MAQVAEFRATIRGDRSDQGKCTIEVEVDGAADVEIRGDRGVLRTLSGRPAVWRRFVCNMPLPSNPEEFRFRGIDGRGSQELLQDPRAGRGSAIVRIQDSRSGSEGYTFDLEWGGGGQAPPPIEPMPRGRARGLGRGGEDPFAMAISSCLRTVAQRLESEGSWNVQFQSLNADNRPGRGDWIAGAVLAQRAAGGRVSTFEFGCSVSFETGDVRSANVNRR